MDPFQLNPIPYQNIVLSTRPVLYWPLSDMAAPRDVMRGRAATVVSGPHTVGFGPLGDRAPVLDGTADYFSASDTGLPAGTAARSVMAWVKTTSSAVNAGIVGYGVQTTNQDWEMRSNNGTLRLTARPNNYDFGTTINDGRWRCCIITFDGTTARGYIDGVKSGSDATPSSASTVLAGATGINIGVWAAFLPGTVAHVAFWSYDIGPGGAAALGRIPRDG